MAVKSLIIDPNYQEIWKIVVVALRLRKEKEKVSVPNRKADDRKWLSHGFKLTQTNHKQ
jgi:hypothetical protein